MMRGKTGVVVAVAGTCVAAGAVIGGATNVVNGAVSPLYFRTIMGWHEVVDVWRAAVAQGILEGLVYGIVFAAIFTSVFAATTRGECPYGYAAGFLLRVLACVIGCWVLGGLVAMGLAALSPEFYRRAFIGVPEAWGPMLRYAWVGGSIWGALFGGLLSAILGPIVLRSRWRQRAAQAGIARDS